MEQFLQIAAELKFDLNQEEIDDLLHKSSKIMDNISAIKNFDLSNYTHLQLPEKYQFCWREDEVVEDSKPEELFQNAINFSEGFVVVKNEK